MDLVVLFVLRAKAFHDRDRILDGWLFDKDLLESSLKSMVLLYELGIFIKRCGANDLELILCKKRLHDVSCIHGTAGSIACTYKSVDLIDEEDDVRICNRFVEHILDTLLELTSGAGYHRTHLHAVYDLALDNVRNVILGDLQCEAFCDRSLTYTRVAYEAGIVLCAADKDLHNTGDLFLTSDNRIDLALLCEFG